MTRNGSPVGVSPKSNTSTMCGWASSVVTFTSRRKRASASGCFASSLDISFTATRLPAPMCDAS